MRPTQDQLDKLGELLYQQPSLSTKGSCYKLTNAPI